MIDKPFIVKFIIIFTYTFNVKICIFFYIFIRTNRWIWKHLKHYSTARNCNCFNTNTPAASELSGLLINNYRCPPLWKSHLAFVCVIEPSRCRESSPHQSPHTVQRPSVRAHGGVKWAACMLYAAPHSVVDMYYIMLLFYAMMAHAQHDMVLCALCDRDAIVWNSIHTAQRSVYYARCSIVCCVSCALGGVVDFEYIKREAKRIVVVVVVVLSAWFTCGFSAQRAKSPSQRTGKPDTLPFRLVQFIESRRLSCSLLVVRCCRYEACVLLFRIGIVYTLYIPFATSNNSSSSKQQRSASREFATNRYTHSCKATCIVYFHNSRVIVKMSTRN